MEAISCTAVWKEESKLDLTMIDVRWTTTSTSVSGLRNRPLAGAQLAASLIRTCQNNSFICNSEETPFRQNVIDKTTPETRKQ